MIQGRVQGSGHRKEPPKGRVSETQEILSQRETRILASVGPGMGLRDGTHVLGASFDPKYCKTETKKK